MQPKTPPIVADDFIKIGGSAVIARINIKTGRDGLAWHSSAHKIFAHARAVPQAATQQPHSRSGQVRKSGSQRALSMRSSWAFSSNFLFCMNPGFYLFASIAEPCARVHRKIPDKLEYRKRVESDLVRQIGCLGMACCQARFAVDDHAAGTANTCTATKIKLQGWGPVPRADLVQGNEKCHAWRLFKLIRLHMRL